MLLTRVLYRKKGGARDFVIVDAAMNDLIRPSLYGAYHEILPLRKGKGERSPPTWWDRSASRATSSPRTGGCGSRAPAIFSR